MPSLQKKELQVFSEREIKKIVKECINMDEVKYIGILISIYTGMRIGEICALKWENIDLNKKIITKETYVVTGEENRFLEPRSYQYIYKKVLEKAKLKYRSFH